VKHSNPITSLDCFSLSLSLPLAVSTFRMSSIFPHSHARGTTCLAADQDTAAALFSEGLKGKNQQGILSHDVIVHSRFYRRVV